MDITQITSQLSEASFSDPKRLPPVDKWNPPFCGDMDLVIKRSGQWWHEGTPFTRSKLVKLFSSILKREDEKYYLVTPVEKIGIQVEDVPFVIIDDEVTEQGVYVITQTGDKVLISEEHPVEVRDFEQTQVPYCNIRSNLWARVHQNVLYRWVERAHFEQPLKGSEKIASNKQSSKLVMNSGKYSFSLGSI